MKLRNVNFRTSNPENLEELGLTLHLRTDLRQLKHHFYLLSGNTIHSAFDASECNLREGEAFWIDVNSGAEYVAMCAVRKIHTSSIKGEIETGRLYHDLKLNRISKYAGLMNSALPALAGNLGYIGALFVKHEFRSQNIGCKLMRFTQRIAHKALGIDFVFATCWADIYINGLPNKCFGYKHIVPCLAPGATLRGLQEFYLMWNAADEIPNA